MTKMMKLISTNLYKYRLFIISLLLLQDAFNCVLYGQSQNDSLQVKEKKTDDGSRIFIKDSGWLIPNSNLNKDVTYKFKVTAQEKKVKLKVTYYDFSESIITNEPLRTIGFQKTEIQYQRMSEYKIKNKVFCYKISYSYVSIGMDYFFSYYDEDGDGKFESLVFYEIGMDGSYLFGNVPHIPQWVLEK